MLAAQPQYNSHQSEYCLDTEGNSHNTTNSNPNLLNNKQKHQHIVGGQNQSQQAYGQQRNLNITAPNARNSQQAQQQQQQNLNRLNWKQQLQQQEQNQHQNYKSKKGKKTVNINVVYKPSNEADSNDNQNYSNQNTMYKTQSDPSSQQQSRSNPVLATPEFGVDSTMPKSRQTMISPPSSSGILANANATGDANANSDFNLNNWNSNNNLQQKSKQRNTHFLLPSQSRPTNKQTTVLTDMHMPLQLEDDGKEVIFDAFSCKMQIKFKFVDGKPLFGSDKDDEMGGMALGGGGGPGAGADSNTGTDIVGLNEKVWGRLQVGESSLYFVRPVKKKQEDLDQQWGGTEQQTEGQWGGDQQDNNNQQNADMISNANTQSALSLASSRQSKLQKSSNFARTMQKMQQASLYDFEKQLVGEYKDISLDIMDRFDELNDKNSKQKGADATKLKLRLVVKTGVKEGEKEADAENSDNKKNEQNASSSKNGEQWQGEGGSSSSANVADGQQTQKDGAVTSPRGQSQSPSKGKQSKSPEKDQNTTSSSSTDRLTQGSDTKTGQKESSADSTDNNSKQDSTSTKQEDQNSTNDNQNEKENNKAPQAQTITVYSFSNFRSKQTFNDMVMLIRGLVEENNPELAMNRDKNQGNLQNVLEECQGEDVSDNEEDQTANQDGTGEGGATKANSPPKKPKKTKTIADAAEAGPGSGWTQYLTEEMKTVARYVVPVTANYFFENFMKDNWPMPMHLIPGPAGGPFPESIKVGIWEEVQNSPSDESEEEDGEGGGLPKQRKLDLYRADSGDVVSTNNDASASSNQNLQWEENKDNNNDTTTTTKPKQQQKLITKTYTRTICLSVPNPPSAFIPAKTDLVNSQRVVIKRDSETNKVIDVKFFSDNVVKSLGSLGECFYVATIFSIKDYDYYKEEKRQLQQANASGSNVTVDGQGWQSQSTTSLLSEGPGAANEGESTTENNQNQKPSKQLIIKVKAGCIFVKKTMLAKYVRVAIDEATLENIDSWKKFMNAVITPEEDDDGAEGEGGTGKGGKGGKKCLHDVMQVSSKASKSDADKDSGDKDSLLYKAKDKAKATLSFLNSHKTESAFVFYFVVSLVVVVWLALQNMWLREELATVIEMGSGQGQPKLVLKGNEDSGDEAGGQRQGQQEL